MRTNSKLEFYSAAAAVPAAALIYRFAASDSREGGSGDSRSEQSANEREDLPYKVEIWDEAKLAVEQVLAVTASGSIGYAAYYAATREYPNRHVTLRHKNRILSQWNGREH